MWVFTKYGFYSVVQDQKCLDQMIVRARKLEHLQNLITRFAGLPAEIASTPNHDYAYRVVMPRMTWQLIVSEMANEIEYSNFKDEAERNSDSVGVDYVDRLHNIWYEMVKLQRGDSDA